MKKRPKKRTIRISAQHLLRSDDGEAFVPDVGRTHSRLADDDAESAGEEVVAAMTSGEYVDEDARDEQVIEEFGGPFLRGLQKGDLERLATSPGDDLV